MAGSIFQFLASCGGHPPHPGGGILAGYPFSVGAHPPNLGGILGGHPRLVRGPPPHPWGASSGGIPFFVAFALNLAIWGFRGGYPSQLRASAPQVAKNGPFLKKYTKDLSTPWPGQFSNFWLLVGGIPPHPRGASLRGISFLWGPTPPSWGASSEGIPFLSGAHPPILGGILRGQPLLCGFRPQFGHLGL